MTCHTTSPLALDLTIEGVLRAQQERRLPLPIRAGTSGPQLTSLGNLNNAESGVFHFITTWIKMCSLWGGEARVKNPSEANAAKASTEERRFSPRKADRSEEKRCHLCGGPGHSKTGQLVSHTRSFKNCESDQSFDTHHRTPPPPCTIASLHASTGARDNRPRGITQWQVRSSLS